MNRKFVYGALVMLLACTASQTFGQGAAFKVNILSPVVRTANVAFEKKIAESSSLQLGFFYTGFSISETEFRGIGITPEFRYYLSDDGAIKGTYLAPFVRYQNLTLKDDFSNEGTLTTFGGGLLIGRQWVFKERVTLDIFIGPAFNSGSAKAKSGSSATFETGQFDGFGVRTGITLGIAF